MTGKLQTAETLTVTGEVSSGSHAVMLPPSSTHDMAADNSWLVRARAATPWLSINMT
jgi:hypothetical protein